MNSRWARFAVFLMAAGAVLAGGLVPSWASEAEDWFNRGNRLRQENRLPDAIDAYQKSAELDPGFWVTHYNLGLAYQKTRQYPKAAEALEKALALAPDNLDIHVGLGNVYNFMEKWEPAIEHLNLVVHRRQGDAVAHGGLGWALYNYRSGPRFRLLVVTNLRQAIELFKQHNQPEAAEATRKTLEEVIADLCLGAEPGSPL